MRVQPIAQHNNLTMRSARGYHDLSKKIFSSDRKDLINLAEFFHTAADKELKQITKSDNKAYDLLKSAIDMVKTRKNCYLADGSNFCKQRAIDLDKKAAARFAYLKG